MKRNVPQTASPLDREELYPLSALPLELREVLVHDALHVVPHDVGVADDGRVVQDLAHAVDHEHDVRNVGKAV